MLTIVPKPRPKSLGSEADRLEKKDTPTVLASGGWLGLVAEQDEEAKWPWAKPHLGRPRYGVSVRPPTNPGLRIPNKLETTLRTSKNATVPGRPLHLCLGVPA